MQKLTQPAEVEPFLSDASNLHGRADGVIFPETEKDIVDFLAESHAHRTPVTVSGYGTGLTGARVPMGGWVMAMHRMNALNFAKDRGPGAPSQACVGAGVQLKTLQSEALRAGWLYPSDPTSLLSFLGGNVATNASGSHAFKYGVTRDHVLRLKVVLANGDVLDLRL
jgi:D-lactate dehydrogenase (cytochrome)